MRNTEGQPQGGQRFGLRTGERRIPTLGGVLAPPRPREKELAPPPTKEEVTKANQGEYAGDTKIVEKAGRSKGLKILGALAVTGAGALGAYEAYKNIPAVHRAVDSAFLDHLKGKLISETPINPVFDPTADKQVIKAGVNTIAVSQTELKRAYEAQSAQNTDGRPTVVFPVKFTAPGQSVNYEHSKQEQFLVGTDSQTGKPVYMERPTTINAKFDKGTEIPVPVENAEVFQFPPRIIDGKQYFVGLWIKFQQNGETFAFGISGADVRTFIAVGEAINAPFVPTNGEHGGLLLNEAKNGLKLPLGTPVALVNIDTNLNSGFSLSRYNPNSPHVNERWESIKPNFITDNSTGQTKLILPQ